MNQAGGILIQARQNTGNYSVIFIALLIIAVLILVYLLLRWINTIHSSPQWLEMHRNMPTTPRNISNVAKLAGLDKSEKHMLEHICMSFSIPNIEFQIRDEKAIDGYFNKEYHELCKKNDKEEDKSVLFTLRYKLEKAHNSTLIITSTKSIVAGQEFLYADVHGTMWSFILYENNSQGLFLTLPPTFAASSLKPDQLSKLDVAFTTKTGIAYSMTVRVIRYEQAKDGGTLMLIGHTNTLKPLQRRSSKRIPMNKKCQFSAVEVTPKGQDKNKNFDFKPMDKKYEGQLQDISANGCRLLCSLPIKQGQYIYVAFDIDNDSGTNETAIGLIVMTTQTVDTSRFILHIKFVKMPIEVRNRIYAFIYNYS